MNQMGYPDTGEAVLLTPGHVTTLLEKGTSTEWLVNHADLVRKFKTQVWDRDENTFLVVAYLPDGKDWVSAMEEADMVLLLGTCFPSITHERSS